MLALKIILINEPITLYTAAAAAKLLQSCPTLCDPVDGSPPGSPDPGILQARTLEWVAISFSNAWKWKVKVKSLSRVQLFMTPWTAAHQAPPSMGFSRQEYWSGVPSPSPLQATISFSVDLGLAVYFHEDIWFWTKIVLEILTLKVPWISWSSISFRGSLSLHL